ncbi:MAG: DUF1178 family protein [Alphaproteobacteria bacterium]|nr:DUF1178 family protein [Alphaproteobacteria bacterium]
MIKYALRCARSHEFEGWFRSSLDFDEQQSTAELSCPVCGSSDVQKAIMAPAISTRRDAGSSPKVAEIRAAMTEAAARARAYVEKNFEHVGARFPEEARRIHYGETDARPIYGEASAGEVRELMDEGVPVAPVPGKVTDVEQAGPAKPAHAVAKKGVVN